ncbi:MAG: trigger factor [Candidatus Paceibacterota bacterium]
MSKKELDYDAKIKKQDGEAIITAVISWDTLKSFRPQALEGLRENVSIDGFRKGKIPEKVLEEHVGPMGIISEMAQLAISEAYPKIITAEKLQTIGRPDVQITKISKGNPLEFKATATLMPTVELPKDYLKPAGKAWAEAESEAGEVSDEDVTEAIESIRQQWARAQAMQEADEDVNPAELEIDEEELPEVTDEFVSQISEAKTVAEFKQVLKENIAAQNERKSKEAKRSALLQAIVDTAKADLPSLIIESELDKMMAQFESDVTRAGMELDDYFKQTEVSKEEMRDKWRPDAARRAKTQLVLNKIAADESIQADDEAVDREVEQIVNQYKEVPEDRARMFVRSRMINENTIQWLEEQVQS